MEKDSAFCVSEKSSYMFPSKYLFEKMNLKWNGSFGYTAKKDTVIINGQNDTLYIKKSFFLEFIEKNGWMLYGQY